MMAKTPPSPPASIYARVPCQETEVSERNLPGDLKLKDPKARDWWLYRVATLICSEQDPKVEQAYRVYALSCGLREELERAILIHDIGASSAPVQKELAQNLVRLFLNLEKDHSSSNAQSCLGSNQDALLESLQVSLPIPVPPERTKRDETQLTSLIRALLELSGGRKDLRQHGFAEEYTAGQNADLYASVFGITRTGQFGDFDSEAMVDTLSKSPVFSEMTFSVQDLKEWTTKMMESLRLGFVPELEGDDDSGWVIVPHPEESSPQHSSSRPCSDCTSPASETESSMEQPRGEMTPFHIVAMVSSGDRSHRSPPWGFRADQYTFVRLSKVGDGNVSETLDERIQVNEVPSIVEVGDGSWEMVVLKSYCRTFQDTLGKIFPGSDVELNHNPVEPTADDLEYWDYTAAMTLREIWFFQRADEIIERGWPAAATFYAHLMEVIGGLGWEIV